MTENALLPVFRLSNVRMARCHVPEVVLSILKDHLRFAIVTCHGIAKSVFALMNPEKEKKSILTSYDQVLVTPIFHLIRLSHS